MSIFPSIARYRSARILSQSPDPRKTFLEHTPPRSLNIKRIPVKAIPRRFVPRSTAPYHWFGANEARPESYADLNINEIEISPPSADTGISIFARTPTHTNDDSPDDTCKHLGIMDQLMCGETLPTIIFYAIILLTILAILGVTWLCWHKIRKGKKRRRNESQGVESAELGNITKRRVGKKLQKTEKVGTGV